jgi:membrane-bound serine protease (ClpP class)
LLINASDAPFLQVSITAIVAVTALLLGFFLFLVAAVLRVRRRRVVTGREGLLDAVGTVRRELEPGKTGIVLVQGELWQAVAPDGRLGVGEKVVVQALDGLLLTVRRATDVVPAPPRPASPAVAKSGTARA